uniref:Ubiquitin-like protease family profile domain-containing protein n=1 Tax=Ditylenchus dipsaci TaxID=166011 RepID=A0A915E3H8_9BILA
MSDCNTCQRCSSSVLSSSEKLLKNGVNSVKEWANNLDIFGSDVVLIPLHLVEHCALVVVRPNKQRLLYYDSLHGHEGDCLIKIKENTLPFFAFSHRLLRSKVTAATVVYLFVNLLKVLAWSPSTCKQEDMDEYRKRMASELQAGKLLKKIQS